MLIQFNFRNFRSYRNEGILDFSATKYTEHSGHVTEIGKEKLLPAAVVFGANGAGKSNVLHAFEFMKKMILHPDGNMFTQSMVFMQDQANDDGTLFEVYFTDENEKSWCYGFAVTQNGIYDEWLNQKSRTSRTYKDVFVRSEQGFSAGGMSEEKCDKISASLGRKRLLLDWMHENKSDKVQAVYDFFEQTDSVYGERMERADKMICDDPDLMRYLASFDRSITDVTCEDDTIYVHKGTLKLPLEETDEGTRRMLALYPYVKNALQKGGVLFADNMDYGLHTLLVRNILITFLNASTNPNHAQLVLTTHDSWLLSNHILRRDEIWFAMKDEQGMSTLYSLAEFQDEDGIKIRKDENHEKNYMMGKYGAVPELDYIHLYETYEKNDLD